MKDMLDLIYGAMMENPIIAAECTERIKFYIYPEDGDTTNPFITIRPMQPPQAVNYASDKNMSYQFFYQIDVQSHDRKKCKAIQQAVKEVMERLGYSQQPNGLDEFFKETSRFVDARRYLTNTKLYDTDY